MKITYDKLAQAAYLYMNFDGDFVASGELEENVFVDINSDATTRGMEFLNIMDIEQVYAYLEREFPELVDEVRLLEVEYLGDGITATKRGRVMPRVVLNARTFKGAEKSKYAGAFVIEFTVEEAKAYSDGKVFTLPEGAFKTLSQFPGPQDIFPYLKELCEEIGYPFNDKWTTVIGNGVPGFYQSYTIEQED